MVNASGEKLISILDVIMQCPECSKMWTVGQAEPDIDGDGSLGCPECLIVLKQVPRG